MLRLLAAFTLDTINDSTFLLLKPAAFCSTFRTLLCTTCQQVACAACTVLPAGSWTVQRAVS